MEVKVLAVLLSGECLNEIPSVLWGTVSEVDVRAVILDSGGEGCSCRAAGSYDDAGKVR